MASMIHRLQRIVQEVNRASDIGHAMNLITQSLVQDLGAALVEAESAGKTEAGGQRRYQPRGGGKDCHAFWPGIDRQLCQQGGSH